MYFLIDYENVNYAGLEGTEFLEKEDTVSFFYSDTCDKIVAYRMKHIKESGCNLDICKLKSRGKNALDFYIASKIGEIFAMDQNAKIAIISADKDYKALLDYWRPRLQGAELRKFLLCRRNSCRALILCTTVFVWTYVLWNMKTITWPEYVSIWILTEDPFGANRMLYTVRSKVEEASDVRFEDGITKLFLYAYGEVGGSEELRSLLRYFVNSDSANATDEELEEIHKIVTSIKENAERRNRYMTLKEMIQFEKEESYNEGVAFGEARGVEQGIEQGMNIGIIIYISSLRDFNVREEQILDNVIQKFSVSKEKAMELMAQSHC